jgi:hypothetical protein
MSLIIDSLPYIDTDLNTINYSKSVALKLIEDEQKINKEDVNEFNKYSVPNSILKVLIIFLFFIHNLINKN